MDAYEIVTQRLEDAGYRVTATRRGLLETLLACADGFTAEDLVRKAHGAGRATVYRMIRLLVDQGLLCKLALDDGAPRYVLSSGFAHHHHFACVGCGAVREFRQAAIEKVLRKLAGAYGDTLVGHRVELYVLCSACAARSPAGTSARAAALAPARLGTTSAMPPPVRR